MTLRARIEDIEQRMYMAYQEGDYEQAEELETQLRKVRGQHNLHDEKEPYSLEGRSFSDD
ncbi:hypothetical protein L4D76_11720 [Photobacterium sagamiensis]|uniref:hypothetical protein n=1 Tax=Photobacterium sagamiensis TaxID=2910241 RepID=UPI003D136949